MNYQTLHLHSTDGLHLEQEIIMESVRFKRTPWYARLMINPKTEPIEIKCRIKAIGTGFIMVEEIERKVK